MAFTQLSPSATPGSRYLFTPKSAATGTHAGTFTALSVVGVPGGAQTFTPKSPAAGGDTHTGSFTALSVMGVPGGLHLFLAKAPAPVVPVEPPVPEPPAVYTGGGMSPLQYERFTDQILASDDDFMELLAKVILPIILE